MTSTSNSPKNSSSDETVIGFKGSEQHHDLKKSSGGNPDHANGSDAAKKGITEAVEATDAEGPVSDALKEAIQK